MEYMQNQDQYFFPGPINNNCILKKDGTIKDNLQIDIDYIYVNQFVWKILSELYEGGPQILVSQETIEQINRIENYPYQQNNLLKKLIFEPLGLKNNQNYCYLNVCLQTLLSIGELNQYFYDQNYKEKKIKTKNVILIQFYKINKKQINQKQKLKYCIAYYNLLQKIKFKGQEKQSINLKEFHKFSQDNFNPYEQHDAQEYLRYLLSEIQDELNSVQPINYPQKFNNSNQAYEYYIKYNSSIIDQLFCGQLICTIQCQRCNNISSQYDPFLDLSLPIEDSANLNDCIEKFFQTEKINGDYSCQKCNQKYKAIKKYFIGKSPIYLVMHLKRFQMFPNKKKQTKKQNIALIWILHSETIYELIGVIVHQGNYEQGHYISFNKRNNQVYFINEYYNIYFYLNSGGFLMMKIIPNLKKRIFLINKLIY
ncbi:ubiquitin carboxyl-terminal hydrolase family protein, putative [Ichthyophthirius multifiliis]|uniref:Ubiquitin carboxyl-terminal hydrolase family protein, putative n=1 Tax=Ichthyophthirius multifiliis TaxID=5932 RepID=G0QWZ5_ICHMU|nr:ubiquitin carboxyl-terminal hydrolase family protein, putative [Ichthyophthirius multifiliis]EGR30259.1 ubiquitin carboxyl-terminal hydrolase family protein, putative [Ichthyophthirius multifiliis]|eukprot:XP_004031855.1 ubiquitin carboxyl-terminal hydrolase family protein, putative [Ichthyophthirius multifiliis]